jgi:hypothetical protein
MLESGLMIATDQDVRTGDDVDLEVQGRSVLPYVLTLDAEVHQDVKVEQESEIDLEALHAEDDLAFDVEVDQEAYLVQKGSVDIDIEEDDGEVHVDLEVDIAQSIEIKDEIDIDVANGSGGDEGEVEIEVDVEQDAKTVQDFEIDIDIEDTVLAEVDVEVEQVAALFQDVDLFLDPWSEEPALGIDTDQAADLESSVAISFDIQGLRPDPEVALAAAYAADRE